MNHGNAFHIFSGLNSYLNWKKLIITSAICFSKLLTSSSFDFLENNPLKVVFPANTFWSSKVSDFCLSCVLTFKASYLSLWVIASMKAYLIRILKHLQFTSISLDSTLIHSYKYSNEGWEEAPLIFSMRSFNTKLVGSLKMFFSLLWLWYSEKMFFSYSTQTWVWNWAIYVCN